jgi:hypothetical protein
MVHAVAAAFNEPSDIVGNQRVEPDGFLTEALGQKSRDIPSPLTQTDPPVLKKADPANARQLAGKGVKGTVE